MVRILLPLTGLRPVTSPRLLVGYCTYSLQAKRLIFFGTIIYSSSIIHVAIISAHCHEVEILFHNAPVALPPGTA
ncbi:hypothetical protein BJY04DRAFT_201533 [Aspergillus karnatakaensis]|uniref:uncharacterized protein n=1 Tax=Aspergillus karnatakaensis TaxID=1810916 RepID=UPI003CCD255E